MRVLRVVLTGLLVLLLAAGSFAAEAGSAPANPATATTPDANPPGTPAGDKLQLRLHLQAGETYMMRMGMVSKITEVWAQPTGAAPWRRMESTNSQWLTVLYKVLGLAPDGTATCRLTFQSMRFLRSGQHDGQSDPVYSYDTTQPPAKTPAWAASIQSLIGKSIVLKMTPDGRAVNAGATADSMTKLLTPPPARPPAAPGKAPGKAPGAAPATEQQEVKEDNRMVKQLLEQSSLGFPQTAVGVGDSWPYKVALSGVYPWQTNIKRTLVKRLNGTAQVTDQGTMQLDNHKTPKVDNDLTWVLKLTGTVAGSGQLDEATGFAQRRHLEQHFGGQMTARTRGDTLGKAQEFHLQLYGKNTIDVAIEPATRAASPGSSGQPAGTQPSTSIAPNP